MAEHQGTLKASICRASSSPSMAGLDVFAGNRFVEYLSEWQALGSALVCYLLRSYGRRLGSDLARLVVLAREKVWKRVLIIEQRSITKPCSCRRDSMFLK